MTFINYQIKDNCYGQLLVGISAVATTITLKSGNGANFPVINPSTPGAILTLIQVDGSGDVVKSEQVKVTNRSADTLTVTRGFAGTVAQSFDADDYIYLYVVASVTDDMKDEIVRLNNDKIDTADFNQALRDDLTPNSIIYVDNAGVENVVVLGANGKYLKSNGTSVAPEFDAPPLDINGQTTDNTTLASDDFIPFYNTSEGAVNKRLAKASTTQEGMIEIATDAEVLTGTDEVRAVNPKQNYVVLNGAMQVNTTQLVLNQGTQNGTSFQITKRTVAFVSIGNQLNGTSSVEVSSNGSSRTTLYTYGPGGSSSFVFTMAPGSYYRGKIVSPDGSSGGTINIQYTT